MIRIRATLVFVVLAALMVTSPSAAQQEGWPPGLSAEAYAALDKELERARDDRLPERWLVLKALEGRSKGASDDQIVEAVQALRERLEIAARILGHDRREDVLVAAAGALNVGVTRDLLQALAEETREDALDMALVVLGDLVQRGVAVPTATATVLALGQHGLDARAFGDFRRSVDDDIRAGLAPSRAAEVRLRGVLRSGGGGGE